MEYRPAHDGDIEQLARLWRRLSADGSAADPRYRLAASADETMPEHILGWVTAAQPTWVAATQEAVVGFIATAPARPHPVLSLPPTLIITDAYVLDRYRRQGLGRRLYRSVHEFARSQGYTAIEVGTLALDGRAIAFWRSLGFGDWRLSLSQDLANPSFDSEPV